MAKKILIATHSTLADGFKKAAHFFTGEGDNIVTLCAYDEGNDDPNPGIDSFFDTLEPNDKVLVFNDLLCGSINQILAKKLHTSKNEFHLITDVNLSVIIGVISLGEEEINAESIRENIELARANMKYMNDEILQLDVDETTGETRAPEEEADFLN